MRTRLASKYRIYAAPSGASIRCDSVVLETTRLFLTAITKDSGA